MIAARWRVAIFFLAFCGGKFFGGDFLEGIYWSTRSNSEHSDFFEGDSFFGGGGVCFGLKVLEKIKK